MNLWIFKNKKLLIAFCVISLMTFLLTLIEINLIVANADDLQEYATKNVVSGDLKTISLLGLLDIGFLTLWTIFFIFILLKIVFPSKKAVQNALFIGELKFLRDMPSELRKGLDKHHG
ncbi:hypothetical protein [Priestia megaterium]|uniref:hypothetical protein n=1 Tax=Priestia megaterium TaxID=1404 RepID=UPI001A93D509|nr:hypothetical protein [Priestia megaterium]QSX24472.1 hypothetical protein J0P05_33125 [Priestia megaterium]